MFKTMTGEPPKDIFCFQFDGQTIEATPGMSVAAALLAHGTTTFRQTHTNGAGRGPFCLMGTCYECLVSIDTENVQACMVLAREGLCVKRVTPACTEAEA